MNAKSRILLLVAAATALFAVAPARAQYGLTNKVLQLDGNGDFYSVTGTLPSFTTQLTAEAWIKTSVATGNQAIVARFNNNSGSFSDDSFQLSVANGRARWQINVGNNAANAILIDGSTFVADGNWHHVAGVYNGIHVALVVDGLIDAPQVAATTPANNPAATPLRIGAALVNGASGFFFNGQIDEVRLWDAAHAATTIINYRLVPFRDRSGRYPVRMSWRLNGPGDTGTGTFVGDAQLVTPSTPVPVLGDSYIRMDGDGEYVRLQSSADLRSDAAITVEAWVRPLAHGRLQSVVSKYCANSGTDTDDEYFLGVEASGLPRFQIATVNGWLLVNGPTALPTDRFTHLAGVYDGTQLLLYVNGVQVAGPNTLSGNIRTTTTEVFIGAMKEGVSRVDSDFFYGNIDDVRIWNVARSAFDIEDGVNSRNSCWADVPSGLMARYIFEGDFLNRARLNTVPSWHGQPRGTAELLIFTGPRSFGQGSCH